MSLEHPELSTHLNYVTYLSEHTKKLEFKYTNSVAPANKSTFSDYKSRLNLIKLTFHSLIEESNQVTKTPEYARVCSAWVAIKGYYLLFYLETILLSLITGQNKLNSTHASIRAEIRSLASSGTLTSNFPELISVIKHSECETTGLQSGANLKWVISDNNRYKQVMKKLREYSLEEFRRTNKIRRLTGKRKITFNEKKIALCDFYYWYRIKSNYRDLEFIAGETAKIMDIYKFYQSYSKSALDIANAYISLINNLHAKRSGSSLKLINTSWPERKRAL